MVSTYIMKIPHLKRGKASLTYFPCSDFLPTSAEAQLFLAQRVFALPIAEARK